MRSEQERAYLREWRRKNPDKARAIRKRWLAKRSEEQKQRDRAASKAWERADRAANPEKYREIARNYYANMTPEQIAHKREGVRRRRAAARAQKAPS